MTFQMVQILGSEQAIKLAEKTVTPRTAKDKVKKALALADAGFAATTRQQIRQ